MGRGSTWSRQLPWLTRLGGCTPTTRRGTAAATSPTRIRSAPSGSCPISATRSARWAGRAVLVGHSMGALHSWCSGRVAARPVSARWWSRTWRRTSAAHHRAVGAVAARTRRPNSIRPNEVDDEFGPVAGQYISLRRSTGPRPAGGCTGTPAHWIEIAAEWGTRDYWTAVEGGARSRACSSRRATPSRLQGRCAKWMKPATGQRIYTCPAPVI